MEPSDDAASSSGSFKANSVSSANSSSNNSQAVNAGAAPSPSCSCGHRAAGSGASAAGSSGDPITVTVAPTTGGQFELKVGKQETIDFVKKTISKRLKVPKERICLLWRDRHLREGTLSENGVCDGSRLTLLPSIETGLLTQRPEQSVMQALESLNDIQVNDFLSGKAPLNLTMRLGDHMMLIQLQLSAVAPVGSTHRRSSAHSSSSSSSHPSLPATSGSASGSASSSQWASSSSTSATPAGLTPPMTQPVILPGAGLSAMLNAPVTPAAQPVQPKAEGGCASMECVGCDVCDNRPMLDTRALAEASRNLTQTLKQLSAEVLTSRSANDANGRRRNRHGAIIESMQHHGKGVYSGTFSGTLNPALQDKQGRPKRDISTIIHILNDLLCATPQYRRAAAGLMPSTSAASASTSSSSSSSRPVSELDDPAAAAQQRKSTGKAGLPTLLLLREESRRYAEENQAIRGKLEQLRMVMEERRARRRARREARVAPYNTWSPKSDSSSILAAASCSAAAAAASPAAGSLNCDAASAAGDSMDATDTNNSADLCQLNTEPVVA